MVTHSRNNISAVQTATALAEAKRTSQLSGCIVHFCFVHRSIEVVLLCVGHFSSSKEVKVTLTLLFVRCLDKVPIQVNIRTKVHSGLVVSQ